MRKILFNYKTEKFIHVILGITAFFLKKFGNRKPSNYQQSSSSAMSTRQSISPMEINSFDDLYEDGMTGQGTIGKYDSSNSSVGSGDYFIFNFF